MNPLSPARPNATMQPMNIDERIEALQVDIETLHSNVEQLFETPDKLVAATTKDGENIRELGRVAQARVRKSTSF